MSINLVASSSIQSGDAPSFAARRPAPRLRAVAPGEGQRKISIFGLGVTDTTLDSAAHAIVARARHGLRTTVGFVNAHCINTMYRDHGYKDALHALDVVYADGSGLRLAARVGGYQLADNVNGTDLLPVLCRHAAKAGIGIYFLGGQQGIAAKAGEAMSLSNPDLDIAGTASGFFASAEDEKAAIQAINDSGAEILLVGMGVPLQERWIQRNRAALKPSIIIGVGGLFDYYSGRIPRAPSIMRRLGVEWVWRLAQEPRRLARRYLLGNIEFMARLAFLRLLAPVEIRQPAQV